MLNLIKIISFSFLVLTTGCFYSSGVISMNDKKYFSEAPSIVTYGDRYFLRFRYADEKTFAFYMSTVSKIKEGKLIFYVPATSSTANWKGKLQFEEIISPQKIQLIKTNLVFWEDPDKKLIPLKVENIQEDPRSSPPAVKHTIH